MFRAYRAICSLPNANQSISQCELRAGVELESLFRMAILIVFSKRMKLSTPLILLLFFLTGCQSPDRIELSYGLNDIRLNGRPMTDEEIKDFTESESKRNTELLYTDEHGMVEKMTLGEFIDSLHSPHIGSTPASHEEEMPIDPLDPFAATPKNERLIPEVIISAKPE